MSLDHRQAERSKTGFQLRISKHSISGEKWKITEETECDDSTSNTLLLSKLERKMHQRYITFTTRTSRPGSIF
jgi:hypothetical protein